MSPTVETASQNIAEEPRTDLSTVSLESLEQELKSSVAKQEAIYVRWKSIVDRRTPVERATSKIRRSKFSILARLISFF